MSPSPGTQAYLPEHHNSKDTRMGRPRDGMMMCAPLDGGDGSSRDGLKEVAATRYSEVEDSIPFAIRRAVRLRSE